MRNGCPLSWGLVEYKDPCEAESTFDALKDLEIQGEKVRVEYYIPGVRAINLYLNLLNLDAGGNQKNGLLPLPQTETVMKTVHSLLKQNPICEYIYSTARL